MKAQDIQEAYQAFLRFKSLKVQIRDVCDNKLSIIIDNMYQDQKMLDVAKEVIVNELNRRISIEEAYLMELGIEFED